MSQSTVVHGSKLEVLVRMAHSQKEVVQSMCAHQSKIYLRRFAPISKSSKKNIEYIVIDGKSVIPAEAKFLATSSGVSLEIVASETGFQQSRVSGPSMAVQVLKSEDSSQRIEASGTENERLQPDDSDPGRVGPTSFVRDRAE